MDYPTEILENLKGWASAHQVQGAYIYPFELLNKISELEELYEIGE